MVWAISFEAAALYERFLSTSSSELRFFNPPDMEASIDRMLQFEATLFAASNAVMNTTLVLAGIYSSSSKAVGVLQNPLVFC